MSSVSFVIPVFNKSSYIKVVVNSLYKQKGKFRKEFIFIDDGSTDNSLEVLKKETRILKNCRIIKQKNNGSAHATNVGIKLSKMKYIKFLDADDIILSRSTELLVEILEKNPDCVLAFGLQRKVEDLFSVELDEKIKKNTVKIIKKPIKLAMRNSMFNPSQFLVRRKMCFIAGGSDERIKFSQEYSMTLRLSRLGNFAKLDYPIAILPKIAPGQISEKKNNQIFRVSKALEFFLEDNPDLELKYKLFAQRRLTARSWRFARRTAKASFFSPWFLYYLIGLFGLSVNIINICKKSNQIYEDFLD